jgi:hypothetical protein
VRRAGPGIRLYGGNTRPPNDERIPLLCVVKHFFLISIVVMSLSALAGVRADAVAGRTGVLRARFVPLKEFGDGWHLPNSAVDPWSPNGRFLALHKVDGVYVFDVSRVGDSPRRVLPDRAPYHSWSPDGGWLVCRVESGTDWKRGLYSLVAVPATGGKPVTLICKR